MDRTIDFLCTILRLKHPTTEEKRNYKIHLQKLKKTTDTLPTDNYKIHTNSLYAHEFKLYFTILYLESTLQSDHSSQNDLIKLTKNQLSKRWHIYQKLHDKWKNKGIISELKILMKKVYPSDIYGFVESLNFPNRDKAMRKMLRAAHHEIEAMKARFDSRSHEELLKKMQNSLTSHSEYSTTGLSMQSYNSKASQFSRIRDTLPNKDMDTSEQVDDYYDKQFQKALSQSSTTKTDQLPSNLKVFETAVYHATPHFCQTKATSCWNATTNALLLQSDKNAAPNKVTKDYFDNEGFDITNMETYATERNIRILPIAHNTKLDLQYTKPQNFTYNWTYLQLKSLFKASHIHTIQCIGEFLGKGKILHAINIVGIGMGNKYGFREPLIIYNDPLKLEPYQTMSLEEFNDIMTQTRQTIINDGLFTNGNKHSPRINLMWYKPATKSALNNLYEIKSGQQNLISDK